MKASHSPIHAHAHTPTSKGTSPLGAIGDRRLAQGHLDTPRRPNRQSTAYQTTALPPELIPLPRVTWCAACCFYLQITSATSSVCQLSVWVTRRTSTACSLSGSRFGHTCCSVLGCFHALNVLLLNGTWCENELLLSALQRQKIMCLLLFLLKFILVQYVALCEVWVFDVSTRARSVGHLIVWLQHLISTTDKDQNL